MPYRRKTFALGFFLFLISFAGCSSLSVNSGGPHRQDFTTGEPIDIPVTIAKVITPLDARLIVAEYEDAAQSSLNLMLLKSLGLTKNQQNDCAQERMIIRGEAGAALPEATINAYSKDGDLVESFVSEADGSFEEDFCLDVIPLEDPVALVVMTGARGSYPVTVTLHEEALPFSFHPYTVSITNVTGIQDEAPVIAGDDSCVAFSALDSSGNPYVVCVPSVAGGFYETYTSSITASLSQIQFASDASFLVGVDAAGRILRVEGSDGSVSVLSDTALAGRTIRLSPDDAFVLSEASDESDPSQVHPVFEPTAVNALTQSSDSISLNEASVADDYDFDWVDADTLIAIRHFPQTEGHADSDKYFGERYDLGFELASGEEDLDITASPLFTSEASTRVIRRLRVNPADANVFSYECENAQGGIDLCRGTLSFATSTLVGQDFGHEALSLSEWSEDGTYIVFQAEFGGDSIIAAYFTGSDEAYALDYGTSPATSPAEDAVIGYLSPDYAGNDQVSVLNLVLHPLTRAFF